MTSFNDREKAFENKFAHDSQLQFKAVARRNKLVGLWAAEKFGMSGDDAAEYAKSVVKADLEEAGDQDVIRKLMADFKENGVEMTERRLEEALAEQYEVAKQQIASES